MKKTWLFCLITSFTSLSWAAAPEQDPKKLAPTSLKAASSISQQTNSPPLKPIKATTSKPSASEISWSEAALIGLSSYLASTTGYVFQLDSDLSSLR